MHREGSIELIDGAVIVRGTDGKVRFEETADPSSRKWAKRGAIAARRSRTAPARSTVVDETMLTTTRGRHGWRH
jgi:hypothetical protein